MFPHSRGARRTSASRARLLVGGFLLLSGAPALAAPAEFIGEARQLMQILTCVPQGKRLRAGRGYCDRFGRLSARFRRRWIDKVDRFMRREVPQAKVPTTVIYPAGGSDLLTALITYPQAREVTIFALERAGDPRTLRALKGPRLKRAIELFYKRYKRYVRSAYSTTVGLDEIARSEITAVLAFNLLALHLRGFEPLSLRFFTFEPDGRIRYVDEQALTGLRRSVTGTKVAALFSNMELTFRRRGSDEKARTFRHVAVNLEDRLLARRPGVLAYLSRRKRVSAVIKAGSYLVWRPQFSKLRDYLLRAVVFMVSDSSGLPPYWATPAGLEQKAFGRYFKPYFRRPKTPLEAVRSVYRLWHKQPHRPLDFRFGYRDRKGNNHLMLSYRPGAGFSL